MPFDPDAYLQENKTSFDPDAYLQEKDQSFNPENILSEKTELPPPKVPYSRSYLAGLGDPWSDEALASYRSIKKGTTYENELPGARRDVEAAYKSSPEMFYTGVGTQIAGSMALPFASGSRALMYGVPAAQGALTTIGESEDKTSPETLTKALESSVISAGLVGAADIITHAPTILGKTTKVFGSPKVSERPYLKEFEKNPGIYMKRLHDTEGAPKEALIKETREGLSKEQAIREKKLSEFEKAKERDLLEYRHEENLLSGERIPLKDDLRLAKEKLDLERKDYEDMLRVRAAPTAEEGDLIVNAVKGMKDKYSNTASIRNQVLSSSGQYYKVGEFKPIFQDAYNAAALESDKKIIQDAWKQFASNATPNGTIMPKQVNDFRAFLQNNVNYGKFNHLTMYERQFSNIATKLNNVLDESIPVNHQLRKMIQNETVKFNKAMDLFGGDYPISKFKTALKDPMKRRDIEELGVDEFNDFIKKIDYQNNLEKEFAEKRHKYPAFGAEAEISGIKEKITNSEKRAEAIKKAIIDKKQSEMTFEKLPFTEAGAESNISQYMYAHPGNPRIQAKENLMEYAKKYHPEGEADYLDKLEKTRVLAATDRVNTPMGSRLVNLMKSVGKPGGDVGEATGAFIGGTIDTLFPSIYRQSISYGAKPNTVVKAAGKTMSYAVAPFVGHELAKNKVSGTKYEQVFSGDPVTDGVNHYVLMSRDPEYAQIYMGNK